MTNKLCLVLSATCTATLLTACGSDATPTRAPAIAVSIQPTTAPATTAAPLPNGSAIKVGLVADVAGVKDQAFNQLAWEGLQQAAREMGVQVKFIESAQPTDDEKNIDALAAEGYNVIITVGSMSAATASKAKQYPHIKFAIIDSAYVPMAGSAACADTVADCYADGGLANVTSLMFAEEQMGFLAGVLAGGMSKSGFVCSVSSLKTPRSDRAIMSFRAGAVWQAGENLKGMNHYINIQTTDSNVPSSADATEGKDTALKLIGAGCDVVFGIAADGALLAAKESNVMAIGADVDQYNTDPAAKAALLSSAQKKVDVAVFNYLRTVADGSVKAGISTATLQNGGVGLAPFHDWDSKIPAELKAQLQTASNGIKEGSIKMDVP